MNTQVVSRRRLLIAFGLSVASGVLAACAPKPTPTTVTDAGASTKEPESAAATAVPSSKEAVSVRYHVRTGSQGDYYQKQADAFAEAQSDVKVVLEQTPGAEYEQKLATLVAGGELGDGFWAAPFVAFYPFSARGIALDMKPLVEADSYDLGVFFPAAIEQLTWEGRLTGWPMGAHPGWTSMYTNLDLWGEAGAALPKWEWTYEDEWLAAAAAATVDTSGDGAPDRYGFLFDYNAQGAYTFIKCWGGDWIDPEDLSASRILSEETVAGLMFMHALVHEHEISPPQEAIVENMFANGLAASWANGIWAVSTQTELVQDKFRWQVFPMPAGPGGRGSFVGIDTMCINSATKHPEAVFEWHKWMTTKEAGLAQVDAGFTPPVRTDAWQDPKLADNINFQAALQWMEVARPTTFPQNARVSEFTTAFNQGFQAFMLEKDDPRAKLEELNDAVQGVLEQPLL